MASNRGRFFKDPQIILKERAKILARTGEEEREAGEVINLICLIIDKEVYGLETGFVRQVVPLAGLNWSPIPGVPDFIIGLANIRGRLVSIMDPGLFLGLPGRRLGDETHLVLVQGRDHLGRSLETGLISDELPLAREVLAKEIEPPPDSSGDGFRDFSRGTSPEMITILDLERLLADPALVIEQ